jgi:hypothetical protein
MKKLNLFLMIIIVVLLAWSLISGNVPSLSDAAHEDPLTKEEPSIKKIGGDIGRYHISTWATERKHGYYILDTTTGAIVGKVVGGID